jgi:hypothetical protein
MKNREQWGKKHMRHTPNKAVFAAITAAVMNYLRAEAEAIPMAAMAAAAPVLNPVGSLYGASGRQEIMDMRRLLSLRLLRQR